MEKPCRKCGEVKHLDEFPRHPKMADGHLHMCRACAKVARQLYGTTHREEIAARRAERYRAHRDELREAGRRRYREDAEYRKHVIEASKNYHKRNIEQARAKARARYQRNRDQANKASAERNRNLPPGLRAEYQRRMRARKKGATVVTLTLEEWTEVCARYDNACAYCGSRKDMGMDHQLPMQRGGGHEKSNVVPCCRSCNTSKGTQTPEEWQKKRRRN